MKYYDCIVSLSDALGGTFDDVFILFVFAWMIAFVLFGWSINALLDIGSVLYDLSKKAAVAVWRKFKH